jgi:ribosome-associated translation inhibitor RaiA
MQPVQIQYQGIDASEPLSTLIFTRAEALGRLHDRIVSLRVVVAAPHHHHRQGNHYHVRIELQVPGHDIVVDHGAEQSDEDAYQAVRHAFDAIRRRLMTSQGRGRAARVAARKLA